MKRKTMPSTNKIQEQLGEEIKLGIDVHSNSYVVVMKIDASSPGRAKRLKPEEFLCWVKRLQQRCVKLYSCYEAGPFGYGLHRRLQLLGVTNYVIRPINWDQHGKQVKTDGRDALQMALSLDGYLRGNARSFSIVRVPSQQQEHNRSLTRQRKTFIKERARNAKRGLSLALYYGYTLKGQWWRPNNWAKLLEEFDAFFISLLEPFRQSCVHYNELIKKSEHSLSALSAQVALPKGIGVVLFEQMEREVCDWNRFKNRKQVSSYTGLCPSEDTSAARRFQGSINKHGNPRLRHSLVECVWLLLKWNPGYRGIVKWQERLLQAKENKSSKKKIVIAIARQFVVDWWRVRTGQVKPETLGFIMKTP